MPEITLDYTVPMSVRVDTDTGRVVAVYLAGESFQSGTAERPQPEQVFTCNHEWQGQELPEYIERDHPVAAAAIAIGESVRLATPELLLPFHYTDEMGHDLSPATYGEVLADLDQVVVDRFVREADSVNDRYSRAAPAYEKRRAEEREVERQAHVRVEPGQRGRESSLSEGFDL